jgi:hypothetical protein
MDKRLQRYKRTSADKKLWVLAAWNISKYKWLREMMVGISGSTIERNFTTGKITRNKLWPQADWRVKEFNRERIHVDSQMHFSWHIFVTIFLTCLITQVLSLSIKILRMTCRVSEKRSAGDFSIEGQGLEWW